MSTETKVIYSRIKNKYDTKENFDKASFTPLKGEILFYDVDGVLEHRKMKIGDGVTPIGDLPFADETEKTVILEEDLYTYTAIGKVTSASNTSPVKLAAAGDNLKTVFNKVFGTQQDTQPTITTSNVKLNASAGTTSYGGGEYGTAVNAATVNITFELKNSGTAQYGYRCENTKTTTSNATFYYPVTKQNNADIKITLPFNISKVEDTTVDSVAYKKLTTVNGANETITMLTPSATYVSYSTKYLYCNLNSSKQVSIKLSLPSGSVTTSQQTRYEQISASVILGAAQKADGTAITSFLTFLQNDATETGKLSGGTKSGTAGAYTISAGSYSPYYLASTSDNLASVAKNVATKYTSGSAVSVTCSTPSYVWFLLTPGTSGSKTIQYEALGQWYEFNGGTTGPVDVSLTLNSGATVTYKGYRTNKQAAAGTTQFKIV